MGGLVRGGGGGSFGVTLPGAFTSKSEDVVSPLSVCGRWGCGWCGSSCGSRCGLGVVEGEGAVLDSLASRLARTCGHKLELGSQVAQSEKGGCSTVSGSSDMRRFSPSLSMSVM